MQVWVSVNEADIGAIKPGMPVRFSCDAFPKEMFEGTVHRIRLNATLSSNVVTYIVEVNAPNDNMRLLPYLTANVKFIRGERKNVLAVPNAVLRFQPPAQYIDKTVPIPEVKPYREAVLYVERSKGKLTPVKVRIGMNNGALAEIITDELKEGDKIVSRIDVVSAQAAAQSDNLKNPFLPSRPARNRNNNRQKK
jgi:HlyD family secretion protein